MNQPLISFSAFMERHLTGEHAVALHAILADVLAACKAIAQSVNQGALLGNMGNEATQNVQGEVQKKLDLISNEIFIERCLQSGYVAGMASEELEGIVEIATSYQQKGQYLLLFDPLDGSSNVNINVSVGTIFSVLKSAHQQPSEADFLQAGRHQVCAGYALYGTSTMLVLTVGNGVHGFTLDEATQEFYLTHPNLQIPHESQEFAINMSNYHHWQAPVRLYIDECLQGKAGERGKSFNMRWVGSMVADIHRILLRGGVFLYPLDSKNQAKGGRLRLMYEANPMAYIVTQAGGDASTGLQEILDLIPTDLHQRIPVMMGSSNEVALLRHYHQAI